MKKEILAQFNNPDLILVAFMLFLVTFIAVAFWTFRKSGAPYYEKMSKAPLDIDDKGVSE